MPPRSACGVGFFWIELGFFGLGQVLGQKSRPVNYYGSKNVARTRPLYWSGRVEPGFFRANWPGRVAHDQV